MSGKAKLWLGITLLLALGLNYIIVGAPIIRRNEALKVEARAILLKYAKPGSTFTDMENDYLLQIFRKEQANIGRQILILNCASATLGLLIISWTAFGVLHSKKKE
jgi:hypothetical protein